MFLVELYRMDMMPIMPMILLKEFGLALDDWEVLGELRVRVRA
jgi:hypothetical protein